MATGSGRVLTGMELIRALVEAGIVPDNCTSFSLHADVKGLCEMQYECLGDDRLLSVVRKLPLSIVE